MPIDDKNDSSYQLGYNEANKLWKDRLADYKKLRKDEKDIWNFLKKQEKQDKKNILKLQNEQKKNNKVEEKKQNKEQIANQNQVDKIIKKDDKKEGRRLKKEFNIVRKALVANGIRPPVFDTTQSYENQAKFIEGLRAQYKEIIPVREQPGAVGRFFAGTQAYDKTYDLLTDNQKKLYNDTYMPHVMSQIGELQNKSLSDYGQGFEPFAQEARQKFEQTTIPSISSRFSQLGAQRSGSFPQLLGQARADLNRDLASQKAQFAQGNQEAARRHAINLLGYGFGTQKENVHVPRDPGFAENVISNIAGPLAKVGTTYLTGGMA